MKDKLKLLTDDVLIELRTEVEAEYKKRRNKLFAVGRFATFEKNGETVTIKITGRGSVNITGVSVDEYGREMPVGRFVRWRCHPNGLTPIVPKQKVIPQTAEAAW